MPPEAWTETPRTSVQVSERNDYSRGVLRVDTCLVEGVMRLSKNE